MNNPDKILELLDLIQAGRISTFSSLKEVISKNGIKVTKPQMDILFGLIKKLYWGTFSDLNFEEYTNLWKALVLPDPKYPSLYGDLKKSIILPNIYISLLDIHGYTAFCQKTRKNINSLHRLDRFVETSIKNTAKKYGVIAKRERGDEVILIGTDPVDIINATCSVVNLFSMKMNLPGVEPGEEPFLPPFEVSGGIVGGYSTTPLIISEKGELQGILVNLSARLQARANEISPNKTKLIVDQSTYHKFLSSSKPRNDLVKNVKFLFNGEIEFKGGKLKVYEIYYREEEKYKDLLHEPIKRLTEAISRGDWQTNIILALCDLGIITSENIPNFYKSVEVFLEGETRRIEVDNKYISDVFSQIKYAILNSKDFSVINKKMKLLVEVLNNIDEFDNLVKEYCKIVYKEYSKIFHEYNRILTKIVEENPSDFLTPDEMEIFLRFVTYKNTYESILEKINSSYKFIQKRSIVWNRAFSNVKSQVTFSMYTGKK